jgi:hypothetical protein
MIVSTELPTATIGRLLLGVGPGASSVRQGLPPAGSAAPFDGDGVAVIGANLARDTTCAAVGNRVASTPLSAINSCAAVGSTSAISSIAQRGRKQGHRINHRCDPGVEGCDLGPAIWSAPRASRHRFALRPWARTTRNVTSDPQCTVW